MIATCVGCGGQAPIPVHLNGTGPLCPLCASGNRPRPRPKDFPTAFSSWDHRERSAMQRVLMSGQFTMGPEVAAFEREFADWHGRHHGIMVNSGSSANLIAIGALASTGYVQEGDKVMVPALAWSTTYAPLIQHGLDLVLIDADFTWNMDPYSPAICEDAKLIVGASILGNAMDLEQWRTIADALNIPFMEDNCESLGARTQGGILTGAWGHLATFSFFYSHQISAIEGGMILTDDDDVANHCRMLRNHGWAKDVDPPQRFEDEYDFRLFGYNVRPLELHAAVAREQLKKLPEFIKYRWDNADQFRSLVQNLEAVELPTWQSDAVSPFGLNFCVEGGQPVRAALVQELRAAGIDCRLPTGGSFRRHVYGAPWAKQSTPRADRIHDCGMFLGNPPWRAEEWIDRAVAIIRRVLS